MIKKKEESILASATELFSQFGYHAVGIDAIAEKSDTALVTLYKIFPSKETLIEKVLARKSVVLQKSITDAVSKARNPMGRLKSIFNLYEKIITSSDFNGCMFVKASEEFPDPDSPIKKASQLHYNWLVAYVVELLNEFHVSNVLQMAKHIVAVLEGLFVNAHSTKKATDLRFSWQCIKQLIESDQKGMTI